MPAQGAGHQHPEREEAVLTAYASFHPGRSPAIQNKLLKGLRKLNKAINKLRAYPTEKSIKTELLTAMGVVLLGAVLGFLAKATDGISVIGDIGTELGVWVFLASVIAAYSRYPYTAALNTMLFFLAMLAAYYLYGYTALGFFPRAYFMGWLMVALLSPLGGFVVWFAKGTGPIGSIAAALPVSVLFAVGYPAFYTHSPVSALTLALGVCLLVLLPATPRQKAVACCVSILLAVLFNRVHLVNWLPFSLDLSAAGALAIWQ